MKCFIGQGTSLAGAVSRLKAAGFPVVGAVPAGPTARRACSGRTAGLGPYRSRLPHVAVVLVGSSADARAVRTLISGAGLAATVKVAPISFGPHLAAEEARLGVALGTRSVAIGTWSPAAGSSPPAPVALAGSHPPAPAKLAGSSCVSPVRGTGRLSTREAEVLRLFAHGALPSQVAQLLYVSPKTVKNHLSHIYAKLGVANRTQAVAVAVREGLVTVT